MEVSIFRWLSSYETMNISLKLLRIETLWGLNISLTSQTESNKGANFDFFTREKVKSPIEIN